MVSTFVIVPLVAPIFGREKIRTSDGVGVHMFLTVLTNRNYVRPEVNIVLDNVSKRFGKTYPAIKIVCLDANFPFFDGFPLLPHLSHTDGRKLDISLVYESSNGKVVNDKPATSGYGIFEGPLKKEHDQIQVCKNKGYWQYDFPKYLTLGSKDELLKFSVKATKKLVEEITRQPQVSKVFIEPHLKSRMGLSHNKIRYHGCQAVRHDDHIHFQIK